MSDDQTIDPPTRQLLDAELERHKAALQTAADDAEVAAICANYIRRINEILRNAGRDAKTSHNTDAGEG